MSLIRKFHDSLVAPVKHTGTETLEKAGVAKRHITGIGAALQTGISSGVVGGALGMIDAQRTGGLDAPIGPLDGWAAAGGLAASVALAGHADGLDDLAREGGGQAAAIFWFRKSRDFFAAKKAASAHGDGFDYSASSPSGTMAGEDGVLAAGRKL